MRTPKPEILPLDLDALAMTHTVWIKECAFDYPIQVQAVCPVWADGDDVRAHRVQLYNGFISLKTQKHLDPADSIGVADHTEFTASLMAKGYRIRPGTTPVEAPAAEFEPVPKKRGRPRKTTA